MDLGINLLRNVPGALCAPKGYMEERAELARRSNELCPLVHLPGNEDTHKKLREMDDLEELAKCFTARNRYFDEFSKLHPFTGIQITKKGLDYLESYVADVRRIIGYDVPLALDHFGRIGVEEIIKLARRLEDYNIAWLEDPISWLHTSQWKRLIQSTTIPICTGEEIYLADNFLPLLESGGIGICHPDALTCGGILETKKLGDLSQKYGVRMVLHQAATPIHAMAAAHIGVATENCWACEFHANDVPWWSQLVKGAALPDPLIQDGFITVPDAPGLGIEELNDQLISEKISSRHPGLWEPTDQWNFEYALDSCWN